MIGYKAVDLCLFILLGKLGKQLYSLRITVLALDILIQFDSLISSPTELWSGSSPVGSGLSGRESQTEGDSICIKIEFMKQKLPS